MAGVNKRAYHSTTRAEQAASTRAAILDAAQELFLDRGYTRTTTAAIAQRARISEAMVFSAFGSKAGVLQALIGRRVVGDDASPTLGERSQWSDAAEAADPRTAVRRFAELAAGIQARTWQLIELSRTASEADPAMAALSAQGAANRRSDCRSFAESALAGRLRDGLSLDQAADLLWTYSSADVYRLLVGASGWSHDRYTDWLSDTLERTLLGDE